jgi:hypothetical protein
MTDTHAPTPSNTQSLGTTDDHLSDVMMGEHVDQNDATVLMARDVMILRDAVTALHSQQRGMRTLLQDTLQPSLLALQQQDHSQRISLLEQQHQQAEHTTASSSSSAPLQDPQLRVLVRCVSASQSVSQSLFVVHA